MDGLPPGLAVAGAREAGVERPRARRGVLMFRVPRLTDEARAVSGLEIGYNEHLYAILFLRTAPELDSIRSSARFRDLVRRIGFSAARGQRLEGETKPDYRSNVVI